MSRRAAAGAAASLLLALVLASQAWAELPRRWRSLRAFAPKELAVRRLGGSGSAFDRKYFSFLENARRIIPRSAKGVRITNVSADQPHVYLAHYVLAPLDVLFGFSPQGFLPGWVVATYGAPPPQQAGMLARFPEGYLWAPRP